MGKKNESTIIKANTVLFFDLDGTLVDTNLANFLAYKKAILSVTKSDHDISYNPDKRFNRSVLKNAVTDLAETDYQTIIRQKEKYFNDFLHETKLITATADIVLKYSQTNKIVLVTNCRKDRATITLKYFGLLDNFSNLFCRELADESNKINKFQNAILKLGVPPNFVIAFENEESEIADAQKAGISIINPTYI